MPGTSTDIAFEHIDQEKLYVDPYYRFQYLAKFADFGEQDIKAIHDAAPAVAPLVPAICDAVYEKLFSFDVTKKFFMQSTDGFTVQADNIKDFSLDNEYIAKRKDFLAKYLVKLVTAKYDEQFVKYLDYVGKMHTNHSGRVKKINIPYIHVSALFTFVTSFVLNALMSAGLEKEAEKRTVLAFNKLLWIQNDFFAKWYVMETQTFIPKKENGSI